MIISHGVLLYSRVKSAGWQRYPTRLHAHEVHETKRNRNNYSEIQRIMLCIIYSHNVNYN